MAAASAPAWTDYQLWYGRDEPPPEIIPLRAGPTTANLVGRDLRNVGYGGVEVAQRVYVAIRDRNWGTVPSEVSNLAVDAEEDRFRVTFDVAHRQQDLALSWRGEIVGAPDGTVRYAMDATTEDDITYKLVGLNVHHGMGEYVGRTYAGETPNGPIAGAFPAEVAPQLVADATEVPIFPPVSATTIELANGVTVRFDYEGDLFEWEDQRNWTDGSFKSQSYPPRRNGFFGMKAGEHVLQSVTITPSGPVELATASGASMSPRASPAPALAMVPGATDAMNATAARRSSAATDAGGTVGAVRLSLGAVAGQALPQIGFGMASHGEALSAREVKLLRALRPDHLRVDLRLATAGYRDELARAADACRALDCGLELAVFVTDDAAAELARLAGDLTNVVVPIRRVLVFHANELATDERWLALAREHLGLAIGEATFAGGTNANFCELNRFRPERAPGDGIAYSINPQIHAFDERSLVENIAAQAATVATARAFGDDRPVVVGPITLKQRFNAVATGDEAPPPPGELPPQVDPRQMSLFLTGWTVGSVAALAGAGAASLTYFETTGWRGLIETDAGSGLPERFPSQPGSVFPVYHVFADLAEWRGGQTIALDVADALAVAGLAIHAGGETHLLVANLTPAEQHVVVGPLPPGTAAVRRLNADTAPLAMTDPTAYRAAPEAAPVVDGELPLTLAPYGVTRIDAGRPS